VRRHVEPDLVLVMIGTNNVVMERFDFLQPYADILTAFRQGWPKAELLLNSLLPMGLYYLAPEIIAGLNDRLRSLAGREKVRYLDAWRRLVDENGRARPGVLEDEVHLTAQGYRLWAGAIEQAARKL
jgi:lysophospholipase L1-like esterase